MKIGEIKKQSLLLIFPEIEARFDSDDAKSVNDGIAELKCDPCLRPYLEGSVPAINRALCEIENAGATKTKHAALTLSGACTPVNLSERLDDLLRVLSIRKGASALKYTEVGGQILVDGAARGEIEVSYKPRAEKIRYASEDACEIDLDYGVAALIPYFVASELCDAENSERASSLRAKFYDGLARYGSGSASQGEVETVYSW